MFKPLSHWSLPHKQFTKDTIIGESIKLSRVFILNHSELVLCVCRTNVARMLDKLQAKSGFHACDMILACYSNDIYQIILQIYNRCRNDVQQPSYSQWSQLRIKQNLHHLSAFSHHGRHCNHHLLPMPSGSLILFPHTDRLHVFLSRHP